MDPLMESPVVAADFAKQTFEALGRSEGDPSSRNAQMFAALAALAEAVKGVAVYQSEIIGIYPTGRE